MDFNFYKSHSRYSSINDFKVTIEKLPGSIEALCSFVQNNLIHSYWIDHYGCKIDDHVRLTEMQIRYANDILNASESKSRLSITEKHSPESKIVSVCRDFSLILCAVLREKGIPARIRCGFSKYLTPGRFEDHWVCEYWHNSENRWVMADAQLDEVHSEVLNFKFNKYDVPPSEFIFAGKAWQLCRSQQENPEKFGIFNLGGLPFIKGNVIRDLYALRKVELMAWDTGWGILKNYTQSIQNEEELELLDELAALSCKSDAIGAEKAINSIEEIKLPVGWDFSQAPTISELLTEHAEDK